MGVTATYMLSDMLMFGFGVVKSFGFLLILRSLECVSEFLMRKKEIVSEGALLLIQLCFLGRWIALPVRNRVS